MNPALAKYDLLIDLLVEAVVREIEESKSQPGKAKSRAPTKENTASRKGLSKCQSTESVYSINHEIAEDVENDLSRISVAAGARSVSSTP